MKKILFFFGLFLLFSCSYEYVLNITPADAVVKINGSLVSSLRYKTNQKTISIEITKNEYLPINEVLENSNFFIAKKINYVLQAISYPVTISIVNTPSEIIMDSVNLGRSPLVTELSHGPHEMILKNSVYPPQTIHFNFNKQEELIFRHQEKPIAMNHLGVFPCDTWPKQVIFTPDSRYIYITLLEGFGFQIFDTQKMRIINYIRIEPYAKYRNFVEGIFIEEKKTFLCSQMATSRVFEFDVRDYENPKLLREIKTKGSWSKVIEYNRVLNQLAVSNWLSNDVSIIDYDSGEIITKLSKIPAPRGLIYRDDGKYLFVLSFDGGFIEKYDTHTWKVVGRVYKPVAAMRHGVLTKNQKRLWVTNMTHSEVYEIDTDKFEILKSLSVFDKTNTIDLGKNDLYAFVSCRGPNNEIDYTLPSPESGKVMIIDTLSSKIIGEIRGGNQPTGLDVSPDNRFLCFSNFQDNSIELYELPESF
ncbi:MAG: YncE family protein [Spirochaetales bacterium]|nr:YncE family protein [Spirochaetales bacterium]